MALRFLSIESKIKHDSDKLCKAQKNHIFVQINYKNRTKQTLFHETKNTLLLL